MGPVPNPPATTPPEPPIAKGIDQGGFDVPLDGFSFRGSMYVFFSTDHQSIGPQEIMGRSVLGVSVDDGFEFTPILSFSRSKFINVSVERARLDSTQVRSLGWPTGTEVLWVFGSGRYRSSSAYLAVADLGHLIDALDSGQQSWPIELRSILGHDGPVRFFSGTADRTEWSSNEDDAVPLFCAADIGELSARRNDAFGRIFLTYNGTGSTLTSYRTNRSSCSPYR
jgi:hypothetical protein